ncbi:unnamed protein product [Amoebophrya sp. A120]|nr:unnamed protein product [Amoebophrya sp. A120]|eukprot:GSA120T00016571001.1
MVVTVSSSPATSSSGGAPASKPAAAENKGTTSTGKPKLVLANFSEKSAFTRGEREIVSRRAGMPRILCPKIVALSNQRFEEVMAAAKKQAQELVKEKGQPVPLASPRGGPSMLQASDKFHIIHTQPKGREETLVATLCEEEDEFFNEDEFQMDTDIDDPERWDQVAEEMDTLVQAITGGDKKPDTLGIGPLPLGWVIPDRQYKPTRPTLKLLPNSKFETFFRSWGLVEKAEMVFQPDRTIYLLVRFSRWEVMAQAALSLWGGRYFGFVPPSSDAKHEEIRPINLAFCDYEQRKKELLAEQTSFEEITRGLNPVQAKAFRELSDEIARLEVENRRLETEVRQHEERKRQREKEKQAELDGELVDLNKPDSRAGATAPVVGGEAAQASKAVATTVPTSAASSSNNGAAAPLQPLADATVPKASAPAVAASSTAGLVLGLETGTSSGQPSQPPAAAAEDTTDAHKVGGPAVEEAAAAMDSAAAPAAKRQKTSEVRGGGAGAAPPAPTGVADLGALDDEL